MKVRARVAAAAIALGALGFVAVPAASAGQSPPSGSNVGAAATFEPLRVGYSLIDSHPLRDQTGQTPYEVLGVVYLYYNDASGNNCAFTEKVVSRGRAGDGRAGSYLSPWEHCG